MASPVISCGIVLAGGLGMRLRQRVADVPKPMAPVGGRPFLEHVLSDLARQGVRRVVVSVGHLGHVVRDHFGEEWQGLRVDYAVEQEPLGTGGATRLALADGIGAPVLLVNGDTWLPLDLGALARAHEASEGGLVMTLCDVDDVARFGSVVVHGRRVVELTEKGGSGAGPINAGAYVLGRRVIERLRAAPERFSFEHDLLEPWVREEGAMYVRSQGPFVDIGVPEDLDRAAETLSMGGAR